MFDFNDIRSATKAEQIRAWCVEQAIDHLEAYIEPVDVVLAAKIFEDFVLNGDTSSAVEMEIMRGLRICHDEVKKTVEMYETSIDPKELLEQIDKLFGELDLPESDTKSDG